MIFAEEADTDTALMALITDAVWARYPSLDPGS